MANFWMLFLSPIVFLGSIMHDEDTLISSALLLVILYTPALMLLYFSKFRYDNIANIVLTPFMLCLILTHMYWSFHQLMHEHNFSFTGGDYHWVMLLFLIYDVAYFFVAWHMWKGFRQRERLRDATMQETTRQAQG